MMSDNLFDMLEYAALGTEWREWLKEVEKTADLVDLRRADTWTVLKQPAKNRGHMDGAETASEECSRRAVAHRRIAQGSHRPVTGRQDMVRPVPAGRPLPGQHRIGLCGGHLRGLLPHPAPCRDAGAEGMAASARRGRGLSLLPDGSGLPPGGTQPAGLPVRRF